MKPENVKCPDCGGEMVSRLNSKNQTRFWGCKDYPKCKGTRDSMGRSRADRMNERKEDVEDVGPDSFKLGSIARFTEDNEVHVNPVLNRDTSMTWNKDKKK